MQPKMLDELTRSAHGILSRTSGQKIRDVSDAICRARRIYVLGVGHSGLLARTFCMKLNHVGLTAFTLFDEINPPFDGNDLLIGVSQSRRTRTVIALAEKAKELGGDIIAVCSRADSALGRIADTCIELSVQNSGVELSTFSAMGDSHHRNVQGAVFGFTLYVLFYSIFLTVAGIRGEIPESIDARHANLE